jgi:WD40 repeat protein
VWSTTTEAELLTLKGHINWVQAVSFSPGGSRILTASHDLTARICDARPVSTPAVPNVSPR